AGAMAGTGAAKRTVRTAASSRAVSSVRVRRSDDMVSLQRMAGNGWRETAGGVEEDVVLADVPERPQASRHPAAVLHTRVETAVRADAIELDRAADSGGGELGRRCGGLGRRDRFNVRVHAVCYQVALVARVYRRPRGGDAVT